MSTEVEYRRLGKSGLRVSVPIIGGGSLGTPNWVPWAVGEEESLEILKAAWDKGINTIDSANMYSNGDSERIIGKFIKKYQIPRNEMIITSKCYGLVGKPGESVSGTPGSTRDSVNQYGLSRAAIFNAIEGSLDRLQTSYIDLYQIHRYDHKTDPEETMKALHDLVESGKVRYIGASSMMCWEFALLNEIAGKYGWTKFVSMQDEYSLLYREEEREMHAYCKYNGIGIIPWGPLNAGHLARPAGLVTVRTQASKGTVLDRSSSETDVVIINRVQELAEKRGKTMSQIALAWAATKITSPIVGLSSVKRLEDSLIKGVELTAEEIKYLEEPYQPMAIRGISWE
ncbi:Aldo keto reductase [Pluteus cervinus]|uniref:Aldo keto reductase n=1 Tax=Pluteus cervinus TaxID=181527 RepID=A0ACD3B4P3_9AGAR|nr:Aldo keto reductase [Pluteus cervinus]